VRFGRSPILVAGLTLVLGLLTAACSGTSSASSSASTAKAAEFKVTVAGDSISVGLGAELRKITPPGVVVKVIGEEGTGLARPTKFDWPTRLRQLAREFPPEVLIFSLSSNDADDLVDTDGKLVAAATNQNAWDAEYRNRLAASFDAFQGTRTSIVWVGHVRTAEDRVGLVNRRVQKLATEVAASRPWVTVTDLAELLGTGEGRADRCLNPDGLHLTIPCLDEAAARLKDRLPNLPAR
jgi:lysophospholipase L1-like esterase